MREYIYIRTIMRGWSHILEGKNQIEIRLRLGLIESSDSISFQFFSPGHALPALFISINRFYIQQRITDPNNGNILDSETLRSDYYWHVGKYVDFILKIREGWISLRSIEDDILVFETHTNHDFNFMTVRYKKSLFLF